MVVDPQSEASTATVDLMAMESGPFMYLDGVTTITFFDGALPIDQLKDRLIRIVQASPWLAGKLVNKKTDKNVVQMAFDPSPSRELILERLLHEIELDASPRSVSCEELIKKLKASKAHISQSGFGLLSKGLPMMKLTVARNPKDSNCWALIFSLSHTVADGYTYYKVLSMLSAKAEVTALHPERKHFFVQGVKDAVGEQEWNTVLGAPGLLANYFSTMVFGGSPRVRAFYVDCKKVEQEKAKVAQKRAAGGAGTEFVSTNDIVTVHWGKITGARLVEMSINFRNRLPDLKNDDAGNYEGCILLSDQDIAEGPSSVRKALQRNDGKFRSTLDPPRKLPGFFEMSRCRYRILSNWASFFSELEFDGCTQTLHFPFLEPSEMPADICIIFRPTKDTLGVYITTRKLKDDVFAKEDSLFGKQVFARRK